jgi:hypothetical protein
LLHDEDGDPEIFLTGIQQADVHASISFYVPYPRLTHACNIGFLFRYRDQGNYYQLVVDYCAPSGKPDRHWAFYMVRNDELELIDSGDLGSSVPVYYRDPEETNHMRLIAIGSEGYFLWNEHFVARLDLSMLLSPGDVGLITAFGGEREVAGEQTRFEDFMVRPLPPEFGPASIGLEHDRDDAFEFACTDLSLVDFIAQTDFLVPGTATEWDVGFLFRATNEKHYRVILATYQAFIYWRLVRDTPAGFHRIQWRLTRGIDSSPGAQNTLTLIAIDRWGYFFINDRFQDRIDISPILDEGDVCVATGMYAGHEVVGHQTRFEDFTVHSLEP